MELNDIETKRIIQRINKFRSWFFEKNFKNYKTLTRPINKNSERNQIYKIINETGEMTSDTTEILSILRITKNKLYAKKFEKLAEMEKILERLNFLKLNQEEAQSLNRLISAGEIKPLIKLTGRKALDRTV